MRANKPLLHGDITASIIDSFFEVHKELGFGFREYILAKKRASIASSSKIGSSNETSGDRSCRCRAVSVDRSIAVSQERCLSIANVGPTGGAGL